MADLFFCFTEVLLMGKKKDVVYLGVCLSPATHEELKKLAAEKELSMSTLVRQLIRDYLANARRRPPKTTGSPKQRLSIKRERAGRPRRRARGRRQFLPCKRGVTCGRGLHSLLQAAVRLCSIPSEKSVRGATTFTVLSSGTAI